MTSAPESAEDFHARARAATDSQGRFPITDGLAVHWEIYPYEFEGLRTKPWAPLLEEERPRNGEDPAQCACADPASPFLTDNVVWEHEHWLMRSRPSQLPFEAVLQPRAHHDLPDLPYARAAEMGYLSVALAAAIEALPSVGRAQLHKWGDGGAHLHLMFYGRPARTSQVRGSFVEDWAELLPVIPAEVHAANLAAVLDAFTAAVGGERRDR